MIMKNLIKYSIGALMAGVMMTACSPDKFDGADPNGIPSVSGVDFQISVDQETNQMIATYTPQPGTYPIWILNGTSYSTLQEVGYNNPEAGTYSIEMKLGNRNGFSQGSISKSFTFNETKIDYSSYFRKICDKEWRIANREVGHMGCGPAGTAGMEWWSAQPNDKKDFGVYDDRITFTADTRKGGSFTYNAGADGKTYVNVGTTWGAGAEADIDIELGNQTSSWSFESYDWEDAEGNVSKQMYIQLAANTAFPYISSDAQYADPKFRVEELTAKKIVLVYETPDRSIAWRFILTSEADVRNVEESGFDANSDFNMWKGITPVMSFYYNPDPSWGNEQTAALEATFKGGNNDYSFTVLNECYADWQAQVHFHTGLNANAATNYDFSVILNADKDINGVIIKLTDEGDTDAILEEHVDLKAGQDYVVWKSDVAGKDMSNLKLATDFGHATGETNISISNIVLKNHADDDGTVVPSGGDDPDKPTMDWDPASGSNLWAAVEAGDAFISVTPWFASDGWSQIGDPTWKHENGEWSLTIPEGMGGSQWQGQCPINTTLTAKMDKKYNFYLVLESDSDLPGVTIKLTETDDEAKHDDNFFFADRHDVKADEPFIYKAEGVTLPKNDAHALSLFFDFGGSPIGANIKISKIYFEESVEMNYDDANNLWKSVDTGDAFISVTPWFANDSWSQIGDPTWSHNGKEWTLTIPEGMGGSQWQGQFPINTTLATAQNDVYNFQCTLVADNDCNGVTIKLTETDDASKHDDNFYFAAQHNVKADEPYVYKATGVTLPKNDAHALSLFFDFGGSPIGTQITIKDIIFEKAQ